MLRKDAFFADHWGKGWPDPGVIDVWLAEPAARKRFFERGWDGGSFRVEGLYGTGNLTPQTGLVKATLYMHVNLDHGIKLVYHRWDGRAQRMIEYDSKGDLARLREFVPSLHDTPLSVGLFVPFAGGCAAIKEFMTTEGELPTCIEWVATQDLPPETFPLP